MYTSALKKIAVAVTLIGAASGAYAAAHNLGTLTNVTPLSYSQSGLSGSFNETLSFTFGLVPAAGIRASFSATGLFGNIGIDPSYSLFGSPFTHLISYPDSTSHIGYLNYDETTHSFGLSDLVPLPWVPGATLALNITGNLGTSSNAAFNLTLAPVPEPETYAMLLAGLGLMGAIARRRKKAAK